MNLEPKGHLRPQFEEGYTHYQEGKDLRNSDIQFDEGSNTPPIEYTDDEGLLNIPYDIIEGSISTEKAYFIVNSGYTTWVPKKAVTHKHETHLVCAKWFKKITWRIRR